MLELEALKPTARSPLPSIAALPIQRQVVSGWYVLCWVNAGVPEVAWLISYQRMPATPFEETVWLPTSASWSPKFRYASRNMPRSPRPSSLDVVPACGTQERDVGHSSV